MAFMLPAAAPDAIAAKLNTELTAVLSDPETQEAMRKQGFEAEPGQPQAVMTRIQAETAKWRALVDKTGIKTK
jgi:tripartite-type tricarboxylate transporter receptor subunit TctC